MSNTLRLSHWDAEIPVVIPSSVLKDLKNYHVMAIRVLYGCYSKGNKGVVLNEDEGMNFQIQISTFLSAIQTFVTVACPVIVVCDKHSLHIWLHYLGKYTNGDISVVDENSPCTSRIILSTVDNLKWLKHTNLPFSIVIVDNLDSNLNRKFVKQLKGQFHVGLTQRNFLRHPDQKLFRNMLLWAVPGVVGKLDEFIQEDDDHLNNLRWGYGEWWVRLPWSFCDTFEKSSREEEIDNDVVVGVKEKARPKRKRKKEIIIKLPSPDILAKDEPDSSQDTIICDAVDDFPILTAIVNDDLKPSFEEQKEDSISKDDILSLLLDEPKMEIDELNDNLLCKSSDDVEARNRDVLSLLYGDGD